MAHLMKWREPRAVSNYELEHEYAPEFKKILRLVVKWSLLIGLPVLGAVWRWMPGEFLPVPRQALVRCSVMPLIIGLAIWLGSKFGVECVVTKKGIMRIFGDKARLYAWNQIESFHFSDYPHACGVRVLTIEVRQANRQFERDSRFSPEAVSELELNETLNKHLPPSN